MGKTDTPAANSTAATTNVVLSRKEILERLEADGLYAQSSDVRRRQGGKSFTVRHHYFYRNRERDAKWMERLPQVFPEAIRVTQHDHWAQWPRDSWMEFEVVFED